MLKYKLSVVIPVRNSVGTIAHTVNNVIKVLKGKKCEIIVVDNASDDNTCKSLDRFASIPNLTLVKNKDLVSMSENWERGLEYINGEYVTYIGGDDGLLQNGIEYLIKLLKRNSFDAISWGKVGYRWPSYYQTNNDGCAKFSFQVKNRDFFIDSKQMRLNVIEKLDHSYLALPNIYNSAISKKIIDRIRSSDGLFFNAQTPDVYSGLRISYEIEKYPFLLYPITISGVSSYSNGIATFTSTSSKIGNEFLKLNKEANNALDKSLPNIQCYSTCIADSYIKIIDRTLLDTDRLKIDYNTLYKKVLNHINLNHNDLKISDTISEVYDYYKNGKSFIKENHMYKNIYYNYDLDFNNIEQSNIYVKSKKKSIKKVLSNFLYIHNKRNILNNIELAENYYQIFFNNIKSYFSINNMIVVNDYHFLIRFALKKILWLQYHFYLLFYRFNTNE